MAFPKQHDRRSNAFTAQCAQHLERGDDSFDQLEQLVEENKNSKASRRDRRLNERRYKRDPYAEETPPRFSRFRHPQTIKKEKNR